MVTVKTKREKKEVVEDSDDSSSEEERKPRKKTPKKPTKKTKKEESSSDEDEQEEEVEVQGKNAKDHLLSKICTIRRSSRGTTLAVWKKGYAPLKTLVQQICNTFNSKGQYNPVIHWDDLYYTRHTLRDILERKFDQGNVSLAEEEMEEAEPTDSRFLNHRNFYLQQQIQQFGYGANAPNGLAELLDWADEEATQRDVIAQGQMAKGTATFDNLRDIFKSGTRVVGRSSETGVSFIGYQVLLTRYVTTRHMTRDGEVAHQQFLIYMEYAVCVGNDQFAFIAKVEQLDSSTRCPIDALPIRLMTKELEDILTKRGERYAAYCKDVQFLAYSSDCFFLHTSAYLPQGQAHLVQKVNNTSSLLKTKGRVIIDFETGRKLGHFPASSMTTVGNQIIQRINVYHQLQQQQQQQEAMYALQNPIYFAQNRMNAHNQQNSTHPIANSELCLTWPAVTGFSLTTKTWGHVLVDGLGPIQFDDKAFDQLVLAPDRKDLISAMVKHSEGVFKDIISGKGGGSIFLLHGPPGVGKTLTAEAVSEMLHKPLYSVSMGELGMTPSEIESKLKEILDLATQWKALVLMDEADIFLERRGQKEIHRNAMVGVIMRLIEYYQGVMFLTSNRVAVFDEAFYSRITVALKYDALTPEIRENVWAMLLDSAKVQGVKARDYRDFPLNGRQIKNCICLAQGLAKAEGVDVNAEHVAKTIRVCMEFVNEMARNPHSKDSDMIEH